MKLDTTAMRFLTKDDFRVLTAVEMGSKNHLIVPTKLIEQISGKLKSSSYTKCISNLAKVGLITKIQNAVYDGYALTYGGYDYLALNSFAARHTVDSVGRRIGVGKESDIYIVVGSSDSEFTNNSEDIINKNKSKPSTSASKLKPKPKPKLQERVLKIHRLGRVSFRNVKTSRDYLSGNRKSASSWTYLSRLAAQREYTFMNVLYDAGFPIPKPIDWSRHSIVMELIDGFPLRQLTNHSNPSTLYSKLMDLLVKLACHGIIHCDYNEFNIMIKQPRKTPSTHNDRSTSPEPLPILPGEEEIILIDFPQCVSIDHPNAKAYFDRDVACIRTFFEKTFSFVATEYPSFESSVKREASLDVLAEASGFSKKMVKDLAKALEQSKIEDNLDIYDESSQNEEESQPHEENEDESDYDIQIEESKTISHSISTVPIENNTTDSLVDSVNNIDLSKIDTKNLKTDKLGNYIFE